MSFDGKRSGWLWESKKYIVFGLIGLVLIYFRERMLPPDFSQRRLTFNLDLTYLDALAVALVCLFLLWLAISIGVRYLRKYKVFEGREHAMSANCRLIEKYLTNTSMTLRSTRVTHWSVAETSVPRQKFRNLITDRASRQFPVRRLYQIKNQDDFLQLQRYLSMYDKYDNYSCKAVVSKDVLMPEILCIGDRAASFSLPEPTAPRELGRAFHFFGRKEISALARYFDILWDIAIPIKSAEKIHRDNLALVESLLKEAEGKVVARPTG